MIDLPHHLQRRNSYKHFLGSVLFINSKSLKVWGVNTSSSLQTGFLSCLQLLLCNSCSCITSYPSGVRLQSAQWSSSPSNVSSCFEEVSFLCVGGNWEVLGMNSGSCACEADFTTELHPGLFSFFKICLF